MLYILFIVLLLEPAFSQGYRIKVEGKVEIGSQIGNFLRELSDRRDSNVDTGNVETGNVDTGNDDTRDVDARDTDNKDLNVTKSRSIFDQFQDLILHREPPAPEQNVGYQEKELHLYGKHQQAGWKKKVTVTTEKSNIAV